MKAISLFAVAGTVGGLGVLIGAFGAHSLPTLLEGLPEAEILKRADWLETGVRYQMVHAVALLALASAGDQRRAGLRIAPAAWLVGIILFSGCLYAMALTGIRVLGAVVPIGGLALIAGWVSLVALGKDNNA